MITAKEKLLKLLEDFEETEVAEILEFTENLIKKHGKNLHEELSEFTSIEYWDNDIYDEVWKDV